MRILAIETSCDETAVAIIETEGKPPRARVRVLANVVSSQVKLHAKFGGVVPHLAKREHQRNLVPVLLRALRNAGVVSSKLKSQKSKPQPKTQNLETDKLTNLQTILEREPDLFARMVQGVLPMRAPKIDAIAITVGPGLAPALWVGVNFAKALAMLWKKPLIPINHLEGHIFANLLPQNWRSKNFQFPVSSFQFPALCLIVSGGHTELVLMRGFGKYRVLGETLDDAAGEAFDKVAKMLGLGFPGGPEIARLAGRGNARAFAFPRPMLASGSFDFSFSGLKTAVFYTLRGLGKLGVEQKRNIAASFQQAAVDVLVAKTVRAAREFRVKTVMIGGGVAANRELREQLGQSLKKALPAARYLTPDVPLTGDNALMIALAAAFGKKKTARDTSRVRADPSMRLGAVS